MKYLPIILLFISFNLSAQYPTEYVKPKLVIPDEYKVITMSMLQTVADATGDALMDTNRKEWGHVMQGATVALFVIEPALIKYDSWGDVTIKAVSLVGARLLLFNFTYNLVRGLPYGFIGTTSGYDKFITSQPDNFVWGKTVFITMSFAITLNEWK